MTTPSRYRKLEQAANLYVQFGAVTMALCETIKMLHGGITVTGQEGEAKEEALKIAMAVSQEVEAAFHNVLDPYVKRLEEIDVAIKDNLPKPPGSLILPGDNN